MFTLSKNSEILLVLAIAGSLNYLPKIGRIFKGFNTMIHETGHAIMSLLFSGEVVSIDILHSGEGIATTKSKSWIAKFLVSIAGYPFSSIISFLFAYLIYRNHAEYILYTIISIAVINIIFWVRNLYGLIWLISLLLLMFLIYYFRLEQVKYYAALSIASFVFIDALFSSWYLLFISLKEPKKAGDAKNLQTFALLPAFIWALFFFLQACYFSLLALNLYYPLHWRFLELGSLLNPIGWMQ